MQTAITEMESCNRWHHKEYLQCEKCGGDDLEWLPALFPETEVDWDWTADCTRCGYRAYFSKTAGKLTEEV